MELLWQLLEPPRCDSIQLFGVPRSHGLMGVLLYHCPIRAAMNRPQLLTPNALASRDRGSDGDTPPSVATARSPHTLNAQRSTISNAFTGNIRHATEPQRPAHSGAPACQHGTAVSSSFCSQPRPPAEQPSPPPSLFVATGITTTSMATPVAAVATTDALTADASRTALGRVDQIHQMATRGAPKGNESPCPESPEGSVVSGRRAATGAAGAGDQGAPDEAEHMNKEAPGSVPGLNRCISKDRGTACVAAPAVAVVPTNPHGRVASLQPAQDRGKHEESFTLSPSRSCLTAAPQATAAPQIRILTRPTSVEKAKLKSAINRGGVQREALPSGPVKAAATVMACATSDVRPSGLGKEPACQDKPSSSKAHGAASLVAALGKPAIASVENRARWATLLEAMGGLRAADLLPHDVLRRRLSLLLDPVVAMAAGEALISGGLARVIEVYRQSDNSLRVVAAAAAGLPSQHAELALDSLTPAQVNLWEVAASTALDGAVRVPPERFALFALKHNLRRCFDSLRVLALRLSTDGGAWRLQGRQVMALTGRVQSMGSEPRVNKAIVDKHKTWESRIDNDTMRGLGRGDVLYLGGSRPILAVLWSNALPFEDHWQLWLEHGQAVFPSLAADASEKEVRAYAYSLHAKAVAKGGGLRWPTEAAFRNYFTGPKAAHVVAWRVSALPVELNPQPWRYMVRPYTAVGVLTVPRRVPLQNPEIVRRAAGPSSLVQPAVLAAPEPALAVWPPTSGFRENPPVVRKVARLASVLVQDERLVTVKDLHDAYGGVISRIDRSGNLIAPLKSTAHKRAKSAARRAGTSAARQTAVQSRRTGPEGSRRALPTTDLEVLAQQADRLAALTEATSRAAAVALAPLRQYEVTSPAPVLEPDDPPASVLQERLLPLASMYRGKGRGKGQSRGAGRGGRGAPSWQASPSSLPARAVYTPEVWEELGLYAHLAMAYVFSHLDAMPADINPFPAAFEEWHPSSASDVAASGVNREELVFHKDGGFDDDFVSFAVSKARTHRRQETLAESVLAIRTVLDSHSSYSQQLIDLLDSTMGAFMMTNVARVLFETIAVNSSLTTMLFRTFLRVIPRRERWAYVSSAELILAWATDQLDTCVTLSRCIHAPLPGVLAGGRLIEHRFLPCEPLGGGTFGVALKAEIFADRRRMARCACKVQLMDGAERELSIARQFTADLHLPPTLGWAYDMLELDDLSFLFLPMMGPSLSDHIYPEDGSSMELASGCLWCWMADLIAGITYLQHVGVVHMDIKPTNMLFSRLGPPSPESVLTLVDFGISKLLDATGHCSAVGGTPLYASPEQCSMVRGDTRMDVWAVASVFHELWYGAPAIVSREMVSGPCRWKRAPRGKQAEITWTPPTTKGARVPREVVGLLKALVTSPEVRPFAASLVSSAAMPTVLERLLRAPPVWPHQADYAGFVEARVEVWNTVGLKRSCEEDPIGFGHRAHWLKASRVVCSSAHLPSGGSPHDDGRLVFLDSQGAFGRDDALWDGVHSRLGDNPSVTAVLAAFSADMEYSPSAAVVTEGILLDAPPTMLSLLREALTTEPLDVTAAADLYASALQLRPESGWAVGDLFCGMGALMRGFGPHFDSVRFSDQDPVRVEMCRMLLERLDVDAEADCHKCTVEEPIPSESWIGLAVLASGPPCQPFSRMGKQQGALDPRNGLPAYLSAVRRVRPLVVFMEEVDNITFHAAVIKELIDGLRAEGYFVRCHLSNAVNYGAPQFRSRFIMVASLLGPIDAPDFTVTRFTTLEDVLGAMGSFDVNSHPQLRLTPHQEEVISRFEDLSRIKRSRDSVRGLPSRGVTASNTIGVSGNTLRLRLDDGVTRRRFTVEEVCLIQGLSSEDVSLLSTNFTDNQILRAVGDAVAVPHASAWASQVRAHLGEWTSLVDQLGARLESAASSRPVPLPPRGGNTDGGGAGGAGSPTGGDGRAGSGPSERVAGLQGKPSSGGLPSQQAGSGSSCPADSSGVTAQPLDPDCLAQFLPVLLDADCSADGTMSDSLEAQALILLHNQRDSFARFGGPDNVLSRKALEFHHIAHDENPRAVIAARSRVCVTFHDIAPAAELHLLTVPTVSFTNIGALLGADTVGVDVGSPTTIRALVVCMAAQALRAARSARQGRAFDVSLLWLGFHTPPSIRYLHLHCVYPAPTPTGKWGPAGSRSLSSVLRELDDRVAAAHTCSPLETRGEGVLDQELACQPRESVAAPEAGTGVHDCGSDDGSASSASPLQPPPAGARAVEPRPLPVAAALPAAQHSTVHQPRSKGASSKPRPKSAAQKAAKNAAKKAKAKREPGSAEGPLVQPHIDGAGSSNPGVRILQRHATVGGGLHFDAAKAEERYRRLVQIRHVRRGQFDHRGLGFGTASAVDPSQCSPAPQVQPRARLSRSHGGQPVLGRLATAGASIDSIAARQEQRPPLDEALVLPTVASRSTSTEPAPFVHDQVAEVASAAAKAPAASLPCSMTPRASEQAAASLQLENAPLTLDADHSNANATEAACPAADTQGTEGSVVDAACALTRAAAPLAWLDGVAVQLIAFAPAGVRSTWADPSGARHSALLRVVVPALPADVTVLDSPSSGALPWLFGDAWCSLYASSFASILEGPFLGSLLGFCPPLAELTVEGAAAWRSAVPLPFAALRLTVQPAVASFMVVVSLPAAEQHPSRGYRVALSPFINPGEQLPRFAWLHRAAALMGSALANLAPRRLSLLPPSPLDGRHLLAAHCIQRAWRRRALRCRGRDVPCAQGSEQRMDPGSAADLPPESLDEWGGPDRPPASDLRLRCDAAVATDDAAADGATEHEGGLSREDTRMLAEFEKFESADLFTMPREELNPELSGKQRGILRRERVRDNRDTLSILRWDRARTTQPKSVVDELSLRLPWRREQLAAPGTPPTPSTPEPAQGGDGASDSSGEGGRDNPQLSAALRSARLQRRRESVVEEEDVAMIDSDSEDCSSDDGNDDGSDDNSGDGQQLPVALQMMLALGASLPDVKLAEDVAKADRYNDDAAEWRDNFTELSRKETVLKQRRLESESPRFSQLLKETITLSHHLTKRLSTLSGVAASAGSGARATSARRHGWLGILDSLGAKRGAPMEDRSKPAVVNRLDTLKDRLAALVVPAPGATIEEVSAGKVKPRRQPADPVGEYTPCLLDSLAYRLKDDGEEGSVQLRRIHNGLLDLGATLSVIDRDSALRIASECGATVVLWKRAKVKAARVVGGGVINVVGRVTIELQMQDLSDGCWHTVAETFNVIDGPTTFILGNTFHRPHRLKLDLAAELASYELEGGVTVITPVSVHAPGCVAATAVTADPLVYTSESTTISDIGFTVVQARVPNTFEGQSVRVTRLLQSDDSYAAKAGFWVPESCYPVGKGGVLALPVFSCRDNPRQLPAMCALARFSAEFECKDARAGDMDIDTIVNALHIEGVDEAEIAFRREQVKNFITARRQGYFSEGRLGRSSVGQFHVETPSVDSGENPPPNIPPRPLSPEQLEAARAEFDKMYAQGILVPSTSPWGAPIVLVRKAGGKGWRLCLDYRAGNAVAVKQHYPLPRVQDTLDRIGEAKYFASLDCLKAFWQIPNSEATQPKTAINFPWGKYEMTSMPMGMQAASATFQRIMDVLLRDLDFCVGFIDDILIFSNTWEDHLMHVALVLDRIGGAGFTFNPGKCEIGKSSTKFLGHLVSAGGTRPDPAKTSSIVNAEFPSTRKMMHHWVGLANYYAPFVKDFALITVPLHDYIHSKPVRGPGGKHVEPTPSEETRRAFDRLKEVLAEDLLLHRPDFNKTFVLTVDAAKKVGGCGADISQEVDGKMRVVSYWSVRWLESTANWAPVEHECYALRRAVERWYDYLATSFFKVRTDSEPLVWLNSLRRPRGRMAEWILEMQALDFVVEHIDGKLNVGSDALSRLALETISMEADRAHIELNMRSPFQAAVSTLKQRCAPWKRQPVACVLTDGRQLLQFEAISGAPIFATTTKLCAHEPLGAAAARCIGAAFNPSAGSMERSLLACLGRPRKVVVDGVVFAVFPRCTSDWIVELSNAPLSLDGSQGRARWLSVASIACRCVSRPGRLFAQRLLAAQQGEPSHEALKALFGPASSLANSVSRLETPSGGVPLLTLSDGRAVPQTLIDNVADACLWLSRINAHLLAQAGTEEDFLFLDLEYDPTQMGCDILQVATGSLILLFDTWLFPLVLTQSSLQDPATGSTLPTLRYWIERSETRLVLQSCANGMRYLRQYGINVSNVFDTCVADAVLSGASAGRNLLAIVTDHVPHHHMTEKETFKHRNTAFKQRPLPPQTLCYAWQDVADGPALYRSMLDQLDWRSLAIVLEAGCQLAERPGRLRRAILFVHDGESCLAPGGLPFMISVDGHADDSRCRVETYGRLRKAAAEIIGPVEHLKKLGKARIVGSSLVCCRMVDSLEDVSGSCQQVSFFSLLQAGSLSRETCWAMSSCRLTLAAGAAAFEAKPRAAAACCDGAEHTTSSAAISSAAAVSGDAVDDEETHISLLALWEASLPLCIEALRPSATAVISAVSPLRYEHKALPPAGSHPRPEDSEGPFGFPYWNDREGEWIDTPSMCFDHTVVLLRDATSCLFLTRNPAARNARQESSVLALPSLRTTQDLNGIHRAQHALQMLFGPLRAFDECRAAWETMDLTAVVTASTGKSTECVGVYCLSVDSLEALPLAEVFKHRRCTPSHMDLYPGYAVHRVEPSTDLLESCSPLDSLILCKAFGYEMPASASAVAPPPLPTPSRQKDATEAMGPVLRRAKPLAPGEQPSGREMQSEHSATFNSSGAGPRTKDPMGVMDELISAPTIATPADLASAQAEDELCKSILLWMSDGPPPMRSVDVSLRPLRSVFHASTFKVHDGILYFVDLLGDSSSSGLTGLRVVMPASLRQPFLTACHEDWGHPGVKRTVRVLRARVWWPTMKADVIRTLAACPTCLFNKDVVYRGSQHIPDNRAHPWHSVQMDLVHLDEARSGKSKALVFYDRFSRDVEAFATTEHCDTDTVCNFIFFEIVPRHGWPRVLYVDRGSNFISKRARAWFKKMGIELRAADAHMHTAVAGCERFNASLREIARAVHFDHGFEWDLVLPLAVFWYKQLVHTATGCSSFYLNHGREAVTPWDIRNGPQCLPPSVDEYVRKSFAALHLSWQCSQDDVRAREKAQRAAHDKKYQTGVQFKKNERVLIRQAGRRSKMHMPFVGPFKIEEVLDRDRYRVSGRRNAKRDHHEFHVSRLKLWPSGADEEEVYLSEDYYDVEKVVAMKQVKGDTLYRVRWQGYAAADDSWVAFADMNGACARAALDFLQAREDKENQQPANGADDTIGAEAGEDAWDDDAEAAVDDAVQREPDAPRGALADVSPPATAVHDGVPQGDDLQSAERLAREARRKKRGEERERQLGLMASTLVGALGVRTAASVIQALAYERIEVLEAHPDNNGCAIEAWLRDVIAWGHYDAQQYEALKAALFTLAPLTIGDLRSLYHVLDAQMHLILADETDIIGVVRHQSAGYLPPSSAILRFFEHFPWRPTADLNRSWLVCTLGSPLGHVDRLQGYHPLAEPCAVTAGKWPILDVVLPVNIPVMRHRMAIQPFNPERPDKFGMRIAIPYWTNIPPSAVGRHSGTSVHLLPVGCSSSTRGATLIQACWRGRAVRLWTAALRGHPAVLDGNALALHRWQRTIGAFLLPVECPSSTREATLIQACWRGRAARLSIADARGHPAVLDAAEGFIQTPLPSLGQLDGLFAALVLPPSSVASDGRLEPVTAHSLCANGHVIERWHCRHEPRRCNAFACDRLTCPLQGFCRCPRPSALAQRRWRRAIGVVRALVHLKFAADESWAIHNPLAACAGSLFCPCRWGFDGRLILSQRSSDVFWCPRHNHPWHDVGVRWTTSRGYLVYHPQCFRGQRPRIVYSMQTQMPEHDDVGCIIIRNGEGSLRLHRHHPARRVIRMALHVARRSFPRRTYFSFRNSCIIDLAIISLSYRAPVMDRGALARRRWRRVIGVMRVLVRLKFVADVGGGNGNPLAACTGSIYCPCRRGFDGCRLPRRSTEAGGASPSTPFAVGRLLFTTPRVAKVFWCPRHMHPWHGPDISWSARGDRIIMPRCFIGQSPRVAYDARTRLPDADGEGCIILRNGEESLQLHRHHPARRTIRMALHVTRQGVASRADPTLRNNSIVDLAMIHGLSHLEALQEPTQ
ncbi:DNA cytosine methyltransferase [bacterium]|nr:DNA cytosine methyltransferase [bacterium]